MSKDGDRGSLRGSGSWHEDTEADKLFELTSTEAKSGKKVIGSVLVNGKKLSGIINSRDRSGANHIAFGFEAAPGISVEWHGRRYEAKVEEVSPTAFVVSDGKTPLRIDIIEDGSNTPDITG